MQRSKDDSKVKLQTELDALVAREQELTAELARLGGALETERQPKAYTPKNPKIFNLMPEAQRNEEIRLAQIAHQKKLGAMERTLNEVGNDLATIKNQINEIQALLITLEQATPKNRGEVKPQPELTMDDADADAEVKVEAVNFGDNSSENDQRTYFDDILAGIGESDTKVNSVDPSIFDKGKSDSQAAIDDESQIEKFVKGVTSNPEASRASNALQAEDEEELDRLLEEQYRKPAEVQNNRKASGTGSGGLEPVDNPKSPPPARPESRLAKLGRTISKRFSKKQDPSDVVISGPVSFKKADPSDAIQSAQTTQSEPVMAAASSPAVERKKEKPQRTLSQRFSRPNSSASAPVMQGQAPAAGAANRYGSPINAIKQQLEFCRMLEADFKSMPENGYLGTKHGGLMDVFFLYDNEVVRKGAKNSKSVINAEMHMIANQQDQDPTKLQELKDCLNRQYSGLIELHGQKIDLCDTTGKKMVHMIEQRFSQDGLSNPRYALGFDEDVAYKLGFRECALLGEMMYSYTIGVRLDPNNPLSNMPQEAEMQTKNNQLIIGSTLSSCLSNCELGMAQAGQFSPSVAFIENLRLKQISLLAVLTVLQQIDLVRDELLKAAKEDPKQRKELKSRALIIDSLMSDCVNVCMNNKIKPGSELEEIHKLVLAAANKLQEPSQVKRLFGEIETVAAPALCERVAGYIERAINTQLETVGKEFMIDRGQQNSM